MKQLKRFSLTVMLALPLVTLAEPLVPFEAEMEVTRYGLVDISAEGRLRLRQNDAGEWHYQLHAETRGIHLREDSWVTEVDGDIRPLRYTADTKVLWSRERQNLTFDHLAQRVVGEADGEDVNESIGNSVYDALGYQLVLQQRLKAGEREMEFDVFREDEVDDFAFRVVGEERLRIAGGTVDTLIIDQTAPLRRKERKRIWIAPELGFVPLRFTREEDGKIREEFRVTGLTLDGERVRFN
ncbi:hypothetical protein BGP77_05960 [Saccharospirillum sp. MSK14-1]|uniref:DUF3108 domain-containing protein n=1 Tax=Saccharospirillum sp. MSK14-1 TaxID=1897632 RepID=UPI000D36FEBC|nr:DUF3108 domain-containing protein [Saccharospirillum sp. MSK14-1]PTY36829.1 hypothetical protein BGP77_05960 [Saccharospirillum sp. MSK14-1]